MGLKDIRFFVFLLGFLFSSGTFAKESEDRMYILSSRPASLLRIAKPSDKLQTKKSTVHEFEKEPVIHKGEELTSPSLRRMLFPLTEPEPLNTMPEMDVVNPVTTVPTINPAPTTTTPTYNPLPTPSNPTPMMTPVTNPYTTPTNPYTTPTNPVTNPYTTPTNPYTTPTSPVTNPYTTPTMGTPTSSSPGQSWCVASPSASQTALQVALDYACGYGGADCSAIQQGGSCFNPDTLRDHASYAFNNYYQKNPVPTSCDFGGSAVITNTDPSTSTCQYPSTSTSSSTLNTTSPTNPTGSTVFGSSPPDYTGTNSSSISMPSSSTLICLLISLVYLKFYK